MRSMCDLLGLKFEKGQAPTAPKLEFDSDYLSRCAKLLAAVSLLPIANGEQTETYHKDFRVIACVITLSVLVLGLLWLVCARWTVEPNTCEKETMTDDVSATSFCKNVGDVQKGEFSWTRAAA